MIRFTVLGTFFRHGSAESGEDRVGPGLAPLGSDFSLNAIDGLPFLRIAHPASPARLPVEAARALGAVVICEFLALGREPPGRPARNRRSRLAARIGAKIAGQEAAIARGRAC